VLIVEDDWVLAAQLESWLSEEGLAVVGVAGSSATGAALAARTRPNRAIVDFNLGGEFAAPLIATLGEMAIKVVVVTGYPDVCEVGGNVIAVLQKPTRKTRVIAALAG
jgi:ActR/RegA family two-component response regulator